VKVGAFTIVSEIGGQGERYLTLETSRVWAHGSRLPPRQWTLFLLSLLGSRSRRILGKFYVFKAHAIRKLIWLAV